MRNHASKFSFLFTKWGNAFEFYSQSEATRLNTKPRLILYLRNHVSNTQSKLSFLFKKCSNAFEQEASIEYLVFKCETTLQTRNQV